MNTLAVSQVSLKLAVSSLVLTSNQTQYVLKYSLDFVFLCVRSLDDSLVQNNRLLFSV